MEPTQDQHGAFMEPVHIDGIRSLYILDSTPLKMSTTSKLSYYRGCVRSGGQSVKLHACDAIIVKFDGSGAEERYERLVALDHPCILKALGHGMGVGDFRKHTFLALQPFEMLFQAYAEKNGPGIDQFGRFTEDFIVMICNIIDGIEELHRSGYFCPHLGGNSIAVIRQYDSISAKLWAFRLCTSDKEKDGDWLRLGYMIYKAANFSKEAEDLLDRITRGDLKGKSILEHSALLTVRKKFKNVTTLYFHVQLNYQRVPNQSRKQELLEAGNICAANLKTDLDKRLSWEVPDWVSKRCSTSPPKTLRGFINQLRTIIQHEVVYIPDEMTRKLTAKEMMEDRKVMDLDHHLHGSFGPIYWAVQRLVAELKLNS